jgi:mycothiol synthase
MPTAVRLRRPSLADVPAMGRLARARELAFEGATETTDEEIAHDLTVPDFDLDEDAWIAEGPDGAIVGYADVLPGGAGAVNATVWTPPDGSALAAAAEVALLDAVEARAAVLADRDGRRGTAVHVFVVPTEDERLALLEARGYGLARTFHRMVLPPDAPLPPTAAPAGVRIEPIDRERDAADVHALLRRAFAEHDLLGVPEDLAAWRHETIDDRRWRPGPSLVARTEDGRIIGAVVGFPEEGQGWVRHLGVDRAHRGRGLGAALLAAAFAAFREAGLAQVGLGVDSGNPSGATRLYEQMGMQVARRVDMHRRVVPAAPRTR